MIKNLWERSKTPDEYPDTGQRQVMVKLQTDVVILDFYSPCYCAIAL